MLRDKGAIRVQPHQQGCIVRAAHGLRHGQAILIAGWQAVGLRIVEQLQAVFKAAQEIVGLDQAIAHIGGKQAARLPPNDDMPPRIPLQPGLLAKLEERGEAILTQVDQATQRLNRLLNDDNQKRFASAIANIDTAAGNIGQLAARMDKRIDPVLNDTSATLKSVQKSADEVGRTAADFGATARRLNQKDGPIDRLAEGSQALSHAADSFNAATLPRINRVTEDASRAVRQLGRTARGVQENPQSLIFGNGELQPGPGEPGFAPPAGARP